MKNEIKNITHYSIAEDAAIFFFGEGGKIQINIYSNGAFRIEYIFNAIQIESLIREALDFMCEPSVLLEKGEYSVSEADDSFALMCQNDTLVEISKNEGVITVFRHGQRIHGGFLGTVDSKLPSAPIRCFTSNDSSRLLESDWVFPIDEDDEFFGLGDKGGVPDRRGKTFSMYGRDALGYDAESSDPLYKSVPFFIRNNPEKNFVCGYFFPNTTIRTVDFGRESFLYMKVIVTDGPFCYWFFTGDDYKQVLNEYYSVTGRSVFPPLFSFGFFGSSMNYADPDDSPFRILDYFNNIEQREIPCDGMYLSSGYLKHPDGKRYTFLWNKDKWTDPSKYFESLAQRGYHFAMNIKPGFHLTHPWYEELSSKGYFIKNKDGSPFVDYFWGGQASFFDFRNPEAYAWWKGQLKKQILDNNCTGVWNDNNEYEIEDGDVPASWIKQIFSVYMAKASHEVFEMENPQCRHWNYSRSGYAGIQRYARTWSGDNTSTWKSLAFNQYMGLGLGLSGMPFFGHDIGGFVGGTPEEELLVRACETAVFQSRFTIHSWNPGGDPTTVWTYPSSEKILISLVREHYRFLPYIYSAAYETLCSGAPIERMIHLEFPNDKFIGSDCQDVMVGSNILKVNILEKGIKTKTVYLPEGNTWIDPKNSIQYAGGQQITMNVVPDGYAHWFARGGSAIPVSDSDGIRNSCDIFKKVLILVFPGPPSTSTLYMDDGVSSLEIQRYTHLDIRVTESEIVVNREVASFDCERISFQLPQGFLFENGADIISYESIREIPELQRFSGNYCK